MSDSDTPRWVFVVAAAAGFVAGAINIVAHNFLSGATFICIGVFQTLAARRGLLITEGPANTVWPRSWRCSALSSVLTLSFKGYSRSEPAIDPTQKSRYLPADSASPPSVKQNLRRALLAYYAGCVRVPA